MKGVAIAVFPPKGLAGMTVVFNPEHVMRVEPAVDPSGTPLLGRCLVITAHGPMMADGSVETVADRLWGSAVSLSFGG